MNFSNGNTVHELFGVGQLGVERTGTKEGSIANYCQMPLPTQVFQTMLPISKKRWYTEN